MGVIKNTFNSIFVVYVVRATNDRIEWTVWLGPFMWETSLRVKPHEKVRDSNISQFLMCYLSKTHKWVKINCTYYTSNPGSVDFNESRVFTICKGFFYQRT